MKVLLLFLLLFLLLLLDPIGASSSSSSTPTSCLEPTRARGGCGDIDPAAAGLLSSLKRTEGELLREIEKIQQEKRALLLSRRLNICIVGFGTFGQFLAKTMAMNNDVYASSRSDYSEVARGIGVRRYVALKDLGTLLDDDSDVTLDVLVLAVSIPSFEQTLRGIAPILARRSGDLLVVDVLSVKEYPRQLLLELCPPQADILATHPMFGPESGGSASGWRGLNMVYDPVRITESPHRRDVLERFLSVWDEQGCTMKRMSCADHDRHAASSQFVTHLVGRLLGGKVGADLKATPIDTKGFEALLKLIANTNADSFDLFYGLYRYNTNAKAIIAEVRRSLDATVAMLDSADRQRFGAGSSSTTTSKSSRKSMSKS